MVSYFEDKNNNHYTISPNITQSVGSVGSILLTLTNHTVYTSLINDNKNNTSINTIDGTLTNSNENTSGGVSNPITNNSTMYNSLRLFSKLKNTLINPNNNVNKLK